MKKCRPSPTRTMRHGALLLFGLVAAAGGHAQSTDWPTAEQRQLVEKRKASFPVTTLVKDVDWYQPQEIVRGSKGKPFNRTKNPTIAATALQQAQALVESKDSYAFLVWRHGKLEHEYYAPGFNRQSQYSTASMAKTVVSLSLGVALQRGLIQSLDDPVGRYLKPWAGHPRGAITIRHYLQMSSNFEMLPSTGETADVYWQYAMGDNIGEAVARWPETCHSGQEFCYANANTATLGWVIEQATGTRYANWLSQSIWQPIGASDASLWIDRVGGSPRYSCCLHASAEDWLRVGVLILNEGRVGSRQVVAKDYIHQVLQPSPTNANYGLHIWRGAPHNPSRSYGKAVGFTVSANNPFLTDDVYYLDGSGGQRVYVIPSADTVIVRIGAARADWDDSQLPNMVLTGIGQ